MSSRFGRYPSLDQLYLRWAHLAASTGARLTEPATSVEGRPLLRYEFGSGPAVLLTGLIHGAELIGGLALLEAVRRLSTEHHHHRLVVLPIVNPDGVHRTCQALRGGWRVYRGNARGVDLNRNFEWMPGKRPWHPFSGSRWRASPHYTGPAPFSEPESQFVADVATEIKPKLSFGFHSFGDLLLYPFAHTRRPNPRQAEYLQAASYFVGAQTNAYRVGPAYGLYPTIGDLDDWLDLRLNTLAFTVEVSRPARALLHPGRFFFPFAWMNPLAIEDTVANVAPAVAAVLKGSVAAPITPPHFSWAAR